MRNTEILSNLIYIVFQFYTYYECYKYWSAKTTIIFLIRWYTSKIHRSSIESLVECNTRPLSSVISKLEGLQKQGMQFPLDH